MDIITYGWIDVRFNELSPHESFPWHFGKYVEDRFQSVVGTKVGIVLQEGVKLSLDMHFKNLRIVPELEILTTFFDLTLNFVTLIGLPQWNGRFLAGELVSPGAEI